MTTASVHFGLVYPLGLEVQREQAGKLAICQMAKEYQNGDTLAIIAERHSTSISTAYKLLREKGVAMRPRGPQRSSEQTALMAKEYRSGDTLRTIAERHSTSATTVNNRLREAGVVMRLASRRSGQGIIALAPPQRRLPCSARREEGLYTIALADSGKPTITRPAMAFLEQGPAEITFSARSMEDVRGTIGRLSAKGYRCELLARVAGRWCKICHSRFNRPAAYCDGCEWLVAAHGYENAFGLCAASGERLITLVAYGVLFIRSSAGFLLHFVQDVSHNDMRLIRRHRAQIDAID